MFGEQCIKRYNVPEFPNVTMQEVKAKGMPTKEEEDNIIEQLRLSQRSIKGGKIYVSSEVFKRTLLFLQSQNKDFSLPKLEKSISKAQACLRRMEAQHQMSMRKKHYAFRKKVTEEIIKTETDYVAYLKEGIEKYYHQIEKYVKESDIPKDSIQVIFCNIKDIIQYNDEFAKQLKKATENIQPNSQWIGVFEYLRTVKDHYEEYLVNYSKSIQRVEEILGISVIKEELDAIKKNDKDLSSYLIMVCCY